MRPPGRAPAVDSPGQTFAVALSERALFASDEVLEDLSDDPPAAPPDPDAPSEDPVVPDDSDPLDSDPPDEEPPESDPPDSDVDPGVDVALAFDVEA